jgi:thymidylate synthase (FAD)
MNNDPWKHLRKGLFRSVEPEVELMACMKPEPKFEKEFTPESLPGYVARWSHEAPSDYAGDIKRNRIMREKKHTTPAEFLSFVFQVYGITKSLQNQWVRQRIGVAWVYRSTRFVSADQNEFVYCTYDYINDARKVEQLLAIDERHAKQAIEDYQEKRKLGATKQDSRKIMPVFWNTPCCFKANVQSLRHFFTLRLEKDAEWEIRRLARLFFSIVMEKAPSLFEDMVDLAGTGELIK